MSGEDEHSSVLNYLNSYKIMLTNNFLIVS